MSVHALFFFFLAPIHSGRHIEGLYSVSTVSEDVGSRRMREGFTWKESLEQELLAEWVKVPAVQAKAQKLATTAH